MLGFARKWFSFSFNICLLLLHILILFPINWLTLHARTNVPLSSAQLLTSFQQPPFLQSLFDRNPKKKKLKKIENKPVKSGL